jgi:hypothetical protein
MNKAESNRCENENSTLMVRVVLYFAQRHEDRRAQSPHEKSIIIAVRKRQEGYVSAGKFIAALDRSRSRQSLARGWEPALVRAGNI